MRAILLGTDLLEINTEHSDVPRRTMTTYDIMADMDLEANTEV